MANMANESLFVDNVVRRIKENSKPVFIYVISDYYSNFVAACDKKLEGRYNCFYCSKIPIVTEEKLKEMLKDIEEHDKLYQKNIINYESEI